MSQTKPEPIGEIRARLGEGPCWDAEVQRLVWVDIFSDRIHEYDPSADRNATIELPGQPGCAVVADAETLVAAVGTQLLAVARNGGRHETIASLPDNPRLRFNDGKCDPAGRLWVGSMDREEREPLGSLYRYEPDAQQFVPMQDGITVSNGLAWSPAGDRMYYIDSPRRAVWVYDFDLARGIIADRRTLAKFSESDGFPDGMAIDDAGRLWVAFWDGGCVRCLDPESGAVLERLDLPASKVTSCAFGGAEMDELYITSAQVEVDLEAEPLAGGLFRASLGVKGPMSSRMVR